MTTRYNWFIANDYFCVKFSAQAKERQNSENDDDDANYPEYVVHGDFLLMLLRYFPRYLGLPATWSAT